MSRHLTALLVSVLVTVLAISVGAAPKLIDYQGYLEDHNGNPLTETLNFEFKIYTDSTGGTSKWSETQNIAVIGGLFNVTLGPSTAIEDTVFNGDSRWLEVKIGGTTLDRVRIVATAYSLRVSTVDGSSGGVITGDLTATGKCNFGRDNSNSGTYAVVAGDSNSASGDWATVGAV
jgi:hypothetical protein